MSFLKVCIASKAAVIDTGQLFFFLHKGNVVIFMEVKPHAGQNNHSQLI